MDYTKRFRPVQSGRPNEIPLTRQFTLASPPEPALVGLVMLEGVMYRLWIGSPQMIIGSYVAVVALMSIVARWQLVGL